jgi:hypothetical protein
MLDNNGKKTDDMTDPKNPDNIVSATYVDQLPKYGHVMWEAKQATDL